MKQDLVVSRLKKIQGQINGIITMYESKRECTDVVMQISAARAALSGVGKELLSTEAVRCSRDHKHAKLDTLLKQLFEIN